MRDDLRVFRFAERVLDDSRERFDWFGDEVVVDFPSLEAAVDRMRASFLANDKTSQLLAAEVRLSPREARAGRRVPLSLALPCTCSGCGGRGEVWSDPCPRCAGSGEDVRPHQVHVQVPSGVHDGARFFFSVSPPHAPPVVVDLRVSVG
jgi:hypothetical protein